MVPLDLLGRNIMQMHRRESYIANIIDNHEYVVDSWLFDALEAEFAKGTYSSRENCDALALELTLKRNGKIRTLPAVDGESYQWRHDWAEDWGRFSSETPMYLIDLKRRPAKYNNYVLSGIDKMIKSYNMNQLTHIVGFVQNIEHDYKLGDVLKFKYEGLLPIKQAVKQSNRKTSSYSLLSKSCLQTSEISV